MQVQTKPICLFAQLLNSGLLLREDRQGLSPVMWACHADRLDNLCVLDEHLKSINQTSWIYTPDCHGWTPIHYALRSKHGSECFEYVLQQYGASSVDNIGRTVLHHAVLLGKLRLCKVIMKYADPSIVDVADQSKRTALHLATAGGHGDIVAFLLAQNANPELRDEHGHSPVTYARIQRLNFCTLVLSKHLRSREIASCDQILQIDPLDCGLHPGRGASIKKQDLQYPSLIGSSGESIDFSLDFMQRVDQNGPSLTRESKPPTGSQRINRKDHDVGKDFKGNISSICSVKPSLYLASGNTYLYDTHENLTIHDEEEQHNVVPFARPASPIPPPLSSIRRSRRIHTANKINSNLPASSRVNGSTAEANTTINVNTNTSEINHNGTIYHTKIVPEFVFRQGKSHSIVHVPSQTTLLVAKPDLCNFNEPGPCKPVTVQEMQPVKHFIEPERVKVCETREEELSNSDVDRRCEVQRVIQIPARLYRASGHHLHRSQSRRNSTVNKNKQSNDTTRCKTELHGPSRTSSCSSISEKDNSHAVQKSLHSHKIYGSIDNESHHLNFDNEDEKVTVGNSRDTLQSNRLLKRNQLSRTFGSFKKLFIRRGKIAEPEAVESQLSTHENLSNSKLLAVKTDTDKSLTQKSGTFSLAVESNNLANPLIKPRLLTPSIDQLTRKQSARRGIRQHL